MNLLTIIIPMFNEIDNIEQCVNVLKKQKNQNFDVSFIDDGSTDGTAEYLKGALKEVGFEYQIIIQKNKGAAEARKVGIERSENDFIMIYDCDDKLSDDFIEKFYNVYENFSDVDIIVPEMLIEDKKGSWKKFIFYTDSYDLMPMDCVINSLNDWHIHGCFAIKRSIALKSYRDYRKYNNNNENFINNDEVITRLNFLNASKIVRNEAIYYYCYNNVSTTHKVNSNRYLTINNTLILDEIFHNHPEFSIEVKKQLISVLWSNIIFMYQYRNEISNMSDWKEKILFASKNLEYIKLVNQIDFKKKIQLTAIKLIKFF